jgi:AraC-like DNA-binding protein
MLVASSERRFSSSRLRSTIVLERRLRGHLVLRDRLVFDTRFATPALGGALATLYVVGAGNFRIADREPLVGPHAFLLAETELERVVPGALTFRSWGHPSITLELRLLAEDVVAPIGLDLGALALGPRSWAAFEAMLATVHDRTPIAGPMRELLEGLADDAIIARRVADSIAAEEPEPLARLWAALAPLYESQATSASIFQLARLTKLSLRQLHRDLKLFAKTYGMPGEGFRDTLKVLRLRTAVILLSAPEATATEVARLVGYGSLEAMGRALRDAGLPAPSVIQQRVAYAD